MDLLPSPIIDEIGTTALRADGFFVVGTAGVFWYYFTDIAGRMYDPSEFTITIKNPAGETVKTDTAIDKMELGIFAYEWTIPIDSTTGKYSVTLDYVVETIDGPETNTITEYFIVVEKGNGQFTLRKTATRKYLQSILRDVQRVPVYNEVIRMNLARTVGQVTFPRHNQTAGSRVYLNGQLKENGYTVDYLNGKIMFESALSKHDEVTMDYNFKWFSDDELDTFLEQGVNIVNIWPPQSTYTIGNVPDRWLIAGIYGGAIEAIRSMMMSLMFQEPAKVFGGLKRASEISGLLETLKKNYEGMLDKMLTQKKYGPYVGLTRTISNPIMTMPGGRSRWFRMLFSMN